MTDPLARWDRIRHDAATWDPPAIATMVVAPHPDDEVLMAGGLISRQRASGIDITVLAVTDGDAAYPELVDGPRLAAIRRDEQTAALAALGVPADRIVRLGVPDGDVAAHEDVVTAAVLDLAADHGLLVAPWTGDHHTDHEACGRAGVRAAAASGLPLVQGVFWTWHHRQPRDLQGLDLRTLHLDDRERTARRNAMACHRSQVADSVVPSPLLSAEDLIPLSWGTEHVLHPGDPTGGGHGA